MSEFGHIAYGFITSFEQALGMVLGSNMIGMQSRFVVQVLVIAIVTGVDSLLTSIFFLRSPCLSPVCVSLVCRFAKLPRIARLLCSGACLVYVVVVFLFLIFVF